MLSTFGLTKKDTEKATRGRQSTTYILGLTCTVRTAPVERKNNHRNSHTLTLYFCDTAAPVPAVQQRSALLAAIFPSSSRTSIVFLRITTLWMVVCVLRRAYILSIPIPIPIPIPPVPRKKTRKRKTPEARQAMQQWIYKFCRFHKGKKTYLNAPANRTSHAGSVWNLE